jgi:FMN phosphatase YigB (HAD superfamily)
VEFFDKVREEVGLRGEDILLIDDSGLNTEAALRARWQAFHWTKHSSPTILRSLCI